MPNRLLRDGICTSDPINSLTDPEEVMFYRLLVVADDFGLMDARPAILKAQCFPLRDTATPPKIEQWLAGLADKGLIVRYIHDGKPYLAINKWEQRQRSRQKYVGPDADGCQTLDGQAAVNCPDIDALGRGKGRGRGATSRTSRELLPLPEGWKPKDETVESLGREFGLRVPEDVDRYVAAFHDACASKGYRYKDFDAAFRNCVRQDWPRLRANGAVRGPKKVAV
jgi:hypothetical protein